MNSKEETKDYLDQIRNKNKNDYKRKNYFKKINKESTQYIRRLITDDHISKTNLQRYNSGERLNEKK